MIFAGRPGVPIPAWTNDFSSPKLSDRVRGGYFVGVMRPEREAGLIFTSCICLLDVHRDNFTFSLSDGCNT